jgi:hypothetical protein
MNKIVVEKRSEDYIASIDEQKEMWGCGPSIAAAIGDLITAHRKRFDIKIEYKLEG